MHKRNLMTIVGAAVALAMLATPAQAQRDPAYQAARDNGQIGEKMDGYLGIVGAETPALRAMVEDLNIRRRANYAERAQANNATLVEYAFTQGCILIARTAPGEMYQAPDGSWQQRGDGPPQRDPRCP
ncbi:YdbL family protein [Aurantiacibacter sp. MUD11]|uniref:YdbL family protein n=1 Tax=Aurantiacibacter sp. MUD11 TaxID=3003265 RepID=UPI0022AA2096|nr:YdbL family protein [Aurantiacibacter sp. MUD11]WAT18075.1 YdbL family protein [Aurantiacibacter sp. MUD11]